MPAELFTDFGFILGCSHVRTCVLPCFRSSLFCSGMFVCLFCLFCSDIWTCGPLNADTSHLGRWQDCLPPCLFMTPTDYILPSMDVNKRFAVHQHALSCGRPDFTRNPFGSYLAHFSFVSAGAKLEIGPHMFTCSYVGCCIQVTWTSCDVFGLNAWCIDCLLSCIISQI